MNLITIISVTACLCAGLLDITIPKDDYSFYESLNFARIYRSTRLPGGGGGGQFLRHVYIPRCTPSNIGQVKREIYSFIRMS